MRLLYISAASPSDSGECGGKAKICPLRMEGLKTSDKRLKSISGGTKLGVALGRTLVEVTETTFNEVEGTRLGEVTKSDGLELQLSPSLTLLLLTLILGTILELCSRTIGTFSIFFFSFLGGT
jgi:hypothetical protein